MKSGSRLQITAGDLPGPIRKDYLRVSFPNRLPSIYVSYWLLTPGDVIIGILRWQINFACGHAGRLIDSSR